MPAAFPCPNPTCSHQFSLQAVQGATTLKCPRCGHAFDFRPATPPAPPTAKPKAAPPGKPAAIPVARPSAPQPAVAMAVPLAMPVAKPTAGTVPVAPPVAPTAPVAMAMPVAPPVLENFVTEEKPPPPVRPELQFDRPGAMIVPHSDSGPSRGGVMRIITVIGLTLVLTFGLFVGVYVILRSAAGSISREMAQKFKEHNFSLVPPEKPWRQDEDLQFEMKLALAVSRSGPRNVMAIEFHDYGKRIPGKPILLDRFRALLANYFGDDVAWQPKAPASRDKLVANGKLAGQDALVLEFEGNRDNVAYFGECHILEYQGFVYWFFTLAPDSADAEEKKALRAEWATLRGGMAVLNQREGWRQQPRDTAPHKGKGYAVAFATDVWAQKALDKENETADLVLEGTDPRKVHEVDTSKAGRAAHVHVLVLPAADDLKAAAEEVRKKVIALNADLYGKTIEEIELAVVTNDEGAKEEREAVFGKTKGFLSRNRLTVKGGSADRFLMLATIPEDGKTIALIGEAPWHRREYWDQEFNELFESFKPGK